MELTPEQIETILSALIAQLGPTFTGAIIMGVIFAVVLNALLKFPVAWGFKKLNGRIGGLTPEELGAAIAESMDIPGYPACFYDPKHFERMKNIERDTARTVMLMEAQDDQIREGDFGCKSPWDAVQVDRIMRTCIKRNEKA